MKLKKRPLTNSLSFILARNCVFVTLVVGLLLSAIQITLDFWREQDAVIQFSSEILAANQFAAADATFHLDAPAAEELAKGILQYNAITGVTISNENGLVLAQLSSFPEDDPNYSPGYNVLGVIRDFSQTLRLKTGEEVGQLTIHINPALASESFIDRSLLVLGSGLVRNILLAFILTFVFYYAMTKEVVGISTALGELDLNNPSKSRIPEVNHSKKTELVELGDNINRMLSVISSDIKERESREQALRASQEELTYQANHDSLSGLINRRGFERYLLQAMVNHQTEQAEHVFCYLDLDQFKIINDTCGHIAGDELLRQLGNLLKANIRDHDVLARLGGDEFGILMAHCNVAQASKVAQNLIDKVCDYRFIWDNQAYYVGASIGIAPITKTVINITDLFRNADIACYAAKDAGRRCLRVYEENSTGFEKIHGDMEWATKINLALEQDRFCLYAQKIQSIASPNKPELHYEVLLRMLDTNGDIIAPGLFLPAAERYHLVTMLDCWVIETHFRYLSEHPEHLQRLTVCAINLSGPSLTAAGFQQKVTNSLDRFGIPPQKICFEITETAAITNLADATSFIEIMRNKGCQFALDDFGTGLSSFAYLKYLPVDYLKIDGVFVKGIANDPIDYAMVKSINEIGHVMGKKTIAEFVENSDVEAKLRTIGVDYSQGYGIARPCPIDEV
jgi:diguanylate cyclase (GGDEF)-like protein